MREPLRDKARIELMLQNICNVKQFTNGLSFEKFEGDLMVIHAVAYNVQSIGEAVYKLTNEFKDSHPSVEWKVIAGMRHVLVHDYYQVAPMELWQVVESDLDPLKTQLEQFLKEM